MFNALNDIECLYTDLECFMLSNVPKACPYIYLSSSNGRGRSTDDQLFDLAFMNNYSQSTFMWTVASCSLSVFS